MSERICPVCEVSVPVRRKLLPHDHDDANGVRQNEREFDVMVPHSYMKDPGLSKCDGSGAIFEIDS